MLYYTVLVSALLRVVAKFPLSSEPFLLALLGTCFILVGNGIRQHGRKHRSKECRASTETAEIASQVLTKPPAITPAHKTERPVRTERWDKQFANSSARNSPSVTQLWLPLDKHKSKDVGAPVIRQ
jgi:hypothetical protein